MVGDSRKRAQGYKNIPHPQGTVLESRLSQSPFVFKITCRPNILGSHLLISNLSTFITKP